MRRQIQQPGGVWRKIVLAMAAVMTVAVGLAAGLTATAHAGTPGADGNYHLPANQTVNHMLFAAGRQVTIDGEVEGDLFCAGQNVTVSGRIRGDVICAAQTLQINGQVDGDVRVAGQTVTISSQVAGSASVAGQTVTLDAKAGIGRDASVAGSDVAINGQIGRDVKATSANLLIGGQVGRNVENYGERLTLAGGANIGGNVDYYSRTNIDRQSGAQIGGQLKGHEPAAHENRQGAGAAFGMALLALLSMIITALVLVVIVPGFFWRTTDTARRSWGKTLLTGFLASIVAPVIIIGLMFTVVGIPLGIFTLLLWILLLFMSGPVSAFLLGRSLLRNSTNALVVMLTGSVVIAIIYAIPVLNILTIIAVVWFGVGSILRYSWRVRTAPATPAEPAAGPVSESAVSKATKPRSTRKPKP